nr:transposase [Proteus mirabilis]
MSHDEKKSFSLKLESLILKLADFGMKEEDICRENGISNACYYNWKSKYGGMEANDVK